MIVEVDVVVSEGVIGVFVTLGVHDAVNDGINEGVREAVQVAEGVKVAGTKGVKLTVLVGVIVGVGVDVGVMVAVLVTTDGVGLSVGEGGVTVWVNVGVAEGVRSDGFGARAMAIQPIQ